MKSGDASIRIVFMADTHLGFDYPLRPRVHRLRRGPDFFANFNRVLEYAATSRADLVVHGGDLFFRSRVPDKIVDMAYESLARFADSDIPIYIVPGNHERSALPSSLYLNHPNIHVFDRPRTYTCVVRDHVLALSGFPFVRHGIRSRLSQLIRETAPEAAAAEARLLCFHQAVEGATVGPSDFVFRRSADVVALERIPESFLAVLSGHIHRKQILQPPGRTDHHRPPVIYPGSIERTSFAEKGEEKGFYDIRLARKNTAAGKRWHITESEFVRLPSRPMVDIFLDSGLRPRDLPSVLRAKIDELPSGAVVRICCDRAPARRLLPLLTGPALRKLFPDSMSIQLGAGFYPRNKSGGR